MTCIRPFRALRYDADRVDLDRVIVPPFDVISPRDRTRLWDSDPHCAIRLVLTREVEEEPETDYAPTAQALEAWRKDGVLGLDPEPVLYLLRQHFRAADGSLRVREGFFAALHLEDYEEGIVRPHERTMDGPKADRLKLLRAAQANLSSVLFLYEDPEAVLGPVLAAAAQKEPVARARDEADTVHELFVIDDAAALAQITGFLAERPVVIADGHHRYETALAYREECRAKREARGGGVASDPFEWTLGCFSNAYAPGSELRPIHRVIRKGPVPRPSVWGERLSGWSHSLCTVSEASALPQRALEQLAPLQGRPAFVADDGSGTLHVFSREFREGDALSVEIVHQEVIQGVFGLDEDAVRDGAVAFPKDASEAGRMVREGAGLVALYINPLEPEDVFRVTDEGRVMPQKSTFYYPKLPTGLVFRVYDAHEAEAVEGIS